MKKILVINIIFWILSAFTMTVQAKTYYGFGFDIIQKYVNNKIEMVITNISPMSSAYKNNIKDGDIVKKINDKDVLTSQDVFAALYYNQKLSILLADKDKPIEIIADTPIPEEQIKTFKEMAKFSKYLSKENIKEKDIVKALKHLNNAIDYAPNKFFLRSIRINLMMTVLSEDNYKDEDMFNLLVFDILASYEETKYPIFLSALCNLYLKVDDIDNAEKYCNLAIEEVNNNKFTRELYNTLYEYFYEHNNTKKASAYADKMIPFSTNEEKLSICFGMGEKYKENYDIEKAIEYYNKCIEYAKDNDVAFSVYATIADYYTEKEDYPKALYYRQRSLKVASDNKRKVIAGEHILDLYVKCSNSVGAVQASQNLLKMDKNNLYALMFLSGYYSNNNYSVCIPYVTKLIYLVPDEKYDYYLLRASLYYNLNNLNNAYNDAKVAYEQSVDKEQRTSALVAMMTVLDTKIINSLKGNKKYQPPSWRYIAPENYIFALGNEDEEAQYWAFRRKRFYNDILNGMHKYSGNDLIKFYTRIMQREFNDNEYYLMGQ